MPKPIPTVGVFASRCCLRALTRPLTPFLSAPRPGGAALDARAFLGMAGEDDGGGSWSRLRGVPGAFDPVPSTSFSSQQPRESHDIHDAVSTWDDPSMRSPRSQRRLANVKAEVAKIASRVRGHAVGDVNDRHAVNYHHVVHRVSSDTTGVPIYDRDRLGTHGTLSRRGSSWWFFDTHPEFVFDTYTDPNVGKCPHLVGNRPTRTPHVIVTERIESGGTTSRVNSHYSQNPSTHTKPTLRKFAHCAECWERLCVKQQRAAVSCYSCGDSFAFSKTKAYPLLTDPTRDYKRDLSATATARAATVVDICFFCAPGWESKGAEELKRMEQVRNDQKKNRSSDAAAFAFSEIPMAERLKMMDRALSGSNVGATRRGSHALNALSLISSSIPSKPGPKSPENPNNTLAHASFVAGTDDTEVLSLASNELEVTKTLTKDLNERMSAAQRKFLPKESFRDNLGDEVHLFVDEGKYGNKPEILAEDHTHDVGANSHHPIAQQEAAAIIAALRRHDDDEDSALRQTREERADHVSEAFTNRTIGDADAAAERLAVLDRQRLDLVLKTDGGVYPIRCSVRYLGESVEKGVLDIDESIIDLDPEEFNRRKDSLLQEQAMNRDSVAIAIAEEEEVTKKATEARDAELILITASRRKEKERQRQKLEKWAKSGVDFSEYKDSLRVKETVYETTNVGQVTHGTTYSTSVDATDVIHGVLDLVLDSAVSRVSVPNATGENTETEVLDSRRVPFTPIETVGIPHAPQLDITAVTPKHDLDLPTTVSQIALRVAPIVDTICVPIIDTVIDQVLTLAKQPIAKKLIKLSKEMSFGKEFGLTDMHTSVEKRKPKKRASPSVDVISAADAGHSLPRHPRAKHPGSGFEVSAWTKGTARRRGRRSKMNQSGDVRIIHNAPHGRVHAVFDENDEPGVPIPLRKELRLAQEITSKVLLREKKKVDEDNQFSHDVGDQYEETLQSAAALMEDEEFKATAENVDGNELLTSDAAFERAVARREQKTRDAHLSLRGALLGVSFGASVGKRSTNAVMISALSHGRVLAPLARGTFITGTSDARGMGSGTGDGMGKQSNSNGRSSVTFASIALSDKDESTFSPTVFSPTEKSPGGNKINNRPCRLSDTTTAASVAIAAAAKKQKVADALGTNLAERKTRIAVLGLKTSESEINSAMTEAEREVHRVAALRKRDRVRRARDALRLRGTNLRDLDDFDDKNEGKGICSVDVFTRSSIKSEKFFKTEKLGKKMEVKYHARVFGNEPAPSPLVLVGMTNGRVGGVPRPSFDVQAVELRVDESDDETEPTNAQDTSQNMLSKLRHTTSASDLRKANETGSVFVDLEGIESGVLQDDSKTLLTAASEKLSLLAKEHALKLATPFPEKHLQREDDESDSEEFTQNGGHRAFRRNGTDANSDDSDIVYQRLPTPIDSDNVPSPTLANLDDPPGPLTPESSVDTISSSSTHEEQRELARRARFRDSSGRSLRLYESSDEKESEEEMDGVEGNVSVLRGLDATVEVLEGDEVTQDEASEAPSPEPSSSPSPFPSPSPPSLRDDYEDRIKRVTEIADRELKRTRDETHLALRNDLSASKFFSQLDETLNFDDAGHNTHGKPTDQSSNNNPNHVYISASFFFPAVPYVDVATPHARGRVERYVGNEIANAIARGVGGVSTKDVSIAGWSRGPPPAIENSLQADIASVHLGLNCEVGRVSTTSETVSNRFETHKGNYPLDENGVVRQDALAVHLVIKIESETFGGRNFRTSFSRLKNARASRIARVAFNEPRDDFEARTERRHGASKRWTKLRSISVALTDVARAGISGVGVAEAAITGSGSFGSLPSPPSPPHLVEHFGGDEKAMSEFVTQKALRDAIDLRDATKFGEPEGLEAFGIGDAPNASQPSVTNWAYNRLSSVLQTPPLPFSDVPKHSIPLTVSPLEQIAVVADAHARRLDPKRFTDLRNIDTKSIDVQIEEAKMDPLVLRERHVKGVAKIHLRLPSRRAHANRPFWDGAKRKVFSNANSYVADENDEYVNPRLARVKTDLRQPFNVTLAFETPSTEYRNPRLDRMKKGRQ